MKRIERIIIILFLLFLSACSKKEYVYFDFGCNNTEYYKCELKNNKLNCDVKHPICEDKEFLGWYEANNYEDQVNLYGSFIKNTIIYARWKDNIEEPSSIIEEPSVIVEEPSSTIEVSSYIEEPSSTKEEVSSTIAEEYTITLMLNNGTSTQFKKVKVKYGETLPTVGSVPTRDGYKFMGWYDNADYTKGVQYYNLLNIPIKKYDKNSDITLYAHWEAKAYTITFNLNGGNGAISSKSAKYGEMVPSIGSTIATRVGYTFNGWYDNRENGTQYYNTSNSPLKKYDKSSNMTLYAHWQAKTYKITFDANGGTGAPSEKNVTYNGTLPNIGTTVPKKTESTFLGWYDSKTGGTQYYNASNSPVRTYNRATNVTLYAQWKTKVVDMEFKPNKWIYHSENSQELKKYASSTMPFAEYVPQQAVGGATSLPLIIFLHGLGEVRYTTENGNLVEKCPYSNCLLSSVFVKTVRNWSSTGLKEIPAVMMAPHLNTVGWSNGPSLTTIDAMIKYARDTYRVNTNKVILIGQSHGAYGIASILPYRPSTFSAVVMISGSTQQASSSQASVMRTIPLKGFSENNSVGDDMRSFFNSIGRINDLTIYNDTDHSTTPVKALTEDKNNDKTSDLIYWAITQSR